MGGNPGCPGPPTICSKLGSQVRLRPDVHAALSRNSVEASWQGRELVLKMQLEPPQTQVALWRAGEKQRSSGGGKWGSRCGALCEKLPAKSQGEARNTRGSLKSWRMDDSSPGAHIQ